jgi:hypothetical protein
MSCTRAVYVPIPPIIGLPSRPQASVDLEATVRSRAPRSAGRGAPGLPGRAHRRTGTPSGNCEHPAWCSEARGANGPFTPQVRANAPVAHDQSEVCTSALARAPMPDLETITPGAG